MFNNEELTNQSNRALTKKVAVRFTLVPVILAAFLLIPAGTFNFWQVYAYFAVVLVPFLFVILYFLKNDPRFLEKRMKTKEKEKPQKIIQIVFTLFFIITYIIPGLDKRFGWSDVPTIVCIITDIVILLGYIMIFIVFKQNSFASRVVEVEQNQKLISTGLYAIVRHPMYVGILIMYIPTPVALGSFWGLIPVLTIPVALVLRIINEEKVLKKELPGYVEYCQKTKYRLLPFIW